ncbi:hypothetical protein TI04_10065 [Achromatium sp. WMS2]|nr:hypothetical protein TI04_10065 [Achromatium sp. WMS2]
MKIFGVCLAIGLCAGSIAVDAGQVSIGGVVTGRADKISGPGNVVVQYTHGPSKYFECRVVNGKESCVPKKGPQKGSKSSVVLHSLLCSDWNKQWNSGALQYKDGKLQGNVAEAISLAAYVRGLMDSQHIVFNRIALNRIYSSCKNDKKQTLSDAVLSKK